MKTSNQFIKICSLLLLIFLAFSCTKEDPITLDNFNTNLSKKNKSAKDLLMPTGNSTTDTENLQTAINTLGHGETLYLGQGTFMVHSSLVRQSVYPNSPNYIFEPFNGTIQGAGKGKTIIRSVRGPGGEDFEEWKDPWYEFTPGTFIILGEGYVGFKDMTFEADSEILASWYYGTFDDVDWHTTGLASYVYIGSDSYCEGNASTDCINVHFKGSLDSSGRQEVGHLFTPWGGKNSTHNVKSCEFEDGLFDMLSFGLQANATINIGGSPSEKVTLTNSYYSAIQFYGVIDCTINASNIEIHNAPGFLLFPLRGNTLSSINITNNNINMNPNSWYAGVEIWNYGKYGDVSTYISKNKIYSEDSDLRGPIFMEGVDNAVISNNKITGKGTSAIYLGIYGSTGHATLKGNNLANWENTGPDNSWGFTAAPIWLGSYITDSFVVGGNNKVNVFDEPGYDESWNPLPPDANGNAQTYDEYDNIVPKNNIFTGVNNMHINIGQDIRGAMNQKVKIKKAKIDRLTRR